MRALDETDPESVELSRFDDVDAESWWAPFVERMFEVEITRGCSSVAGPRYCPDDSVTRAQMAVFLTRAFELPEAPDAGFGDIGDSFARQQINALASAGITGGCGGDSPSYCPDDVVTRGQMAVLPARALGLIERPDSVRFIAVDAGFQHTCAVRADNTAACWGRNDHGKTEVPEGRFTDIASGVNHSCGLRNDKTIMCWGDNYSHQTEAPEGTFNSLSAGYSHSCAIRVDDSIVCWGLAGASWVDAPGGAFTTVAAGTSHSCGLRTDGTVECWGSSHFGQADAPGGEFASVTAGDLHSCGLRTDATITCWGARSLFFDKGQSIAPAGSFAAVSAGFRHSCGLRTNGTIVCWGDNWLGQTEAPAGSFAAVSAGGQHSCGLRTDATVVCWGRAHVGRTEAPNSEFASVAAGTDFSCGLRADGTIACWGHNDDGQTYEARGRFTSITAGHQHACAVRADATAYCWGQGRFGQTAVPEGRFSALSAGQSRTCGLLISTELTCWGSGLSGAAAAPPGSFSAVSSGPYHTCGLRAGGTIACWGRDQDGETDAPEGIFQAVSAGNRHSCGLRADGSVSCWGDNTQGQSAAPEGVFEAVSAGASHSCALRIDATVACWGNDSYGESNPPEGAFTAVSAGARHSCGLRTDATVTCWGLRTTVSHPFGVAANPSHKIPDPEACRPFGLWETGAGFPPPSQVPSTVGTLRVAVLFVDFPDAMAVNSTEQEGLGGLPHVRRYFESASHGRLLIDFVPLHGWLRLGLEANEAESLARVDYEALRLADPEFDFSGIDVLVVVMPSSHFAGGNSPVRVVTEEGPVSIVRVNAFYHGSGQSSQWGQTAARGLARSLGLPDLYPHDPDRHFLPAVPPEGKRWRTVSLGLMGLAASVPVDDPDPWGFTHAAEMLAWSRWQMGWIDAQQVRCIREPAATVTLSPVADPGAGTQMAAVPLSDDEVIVLESRRNIGYDEQAALGGGGVLVYTVQGSILSGNLPIKVAGDAGRGHTFQSPILSVGQSVIVRGYTITVVSDDGETHAVTITKN